MPNGSGLEWVGCGLGLGFGFGFGWGWLGSAWSGVEWNGMAGAEQKGHNAAYRPTD